MIFGQLATSLFDLPKIFHLGGGGLMNLIEKYNEGMSSDNPGCIFGLLQLILGKQDRLVGDDLYSANDPGERVET